MSIKEQQKQTGTIKWFKNDKGFSFAVNEAGEDVFVHYREIVGDGFKKLATGQQIEFTQVRTAKGWQALAVEALEQLRIEGPRLRPFL